MSTTAPLWPRFRADQRLVRAVVRSPRLTSFVPAAKLEPLLAQYAAAKSAADTANAIRLDDVDVRVQTQQAIDRGETVNVPAAFKSMADQAAQAAAHSEARSFFAGLPDQYAPKIAALIHASERQLFEGLSGQLTALLDEAEGVAAELDGAFEAEAAMDADKIPAFTRWRDLARAYADLRADHTKLLGAAGNAQTDDWPFAFFANPEMGDPDLTRRVREGAPRSGWRTSAYEPFPMADATSRDHFVAAVTLRSLLEPHVGTAEEARAARTAAYRAHNPKPVVLSGGARVDR